MRVTRPFELMIEVMIYIWLLDLLLNPTKANDFDLRRFSS